MSDKKSRVLILGGGFAGLYAALGQTGGGRYLIVFFIHKRG